MSSNSSTPSPSATSSDSAVSSSSTSDSGGGGGFSPPSSTLYLLTFLATLFVLLFVSCAIVLRSFVLRRRFRQQIEEQIAAGLLPPDALWNSRRRDFGEKPKLYDVGVFPSSQVESWTSMSPISAKVLSNTTASSSDISSETSSISPSPTRLSRLAGLLRRPRPPIESLPDEDEPESVALLNGGNVQLAVLLAMPSARKIHDGVPDVVIGVSQIPLRADGAYTPAT
ncbi:hypothetical protein PHLGIDRAFT_119900 [Phlebiopsis gigantea 11061_1 CR5-6]|uniref:Uncharacterized protein n=1 Tax=Phlebiopsis gigantea (strain 11061_1 CR5-6) TaxID=745531 RepID=A0A0C3S8J4_PHLG1|nr:hypothetical protein PHLGIDRAFT_119900 [Phlebiopsis gigantea 11061_1 CR5-6]